jgi:thiol:disulfide interchange protein
MDHVESLDDLGNQRTSTANPSLRLGLFVLLVAGALICARQFGPKHALAGAGWTSDWDAAVQQSKSTGKPALVLFTADWCPSCKMLESDVLTQSQVKQHLQDNYTLVIVDLSEQGGPNDARAREFSIKSIPTLIVYDKSGAERDRSHGMPAEQLLAWLKSDS